MSKNCIRQKVSLTQRRKKKDANFQVIIYNFSRDDAIPATEKAAASLRSEGLQPVYGVIDHI